jgi:cardiolipin synthase
LLLAREANVVVLDAPFAKGLREQLELAILHGAQRLDGQRYAQRPFGQKLRDLAALLLMRMLLFVAGKRY